MLSDLIDKLYDRFLEEGFSPSFFWSLSLWEVQDILVATQKKKVEELKLDVLKLNVQAQQIAEYIAKTKDIKNEMKLRNLWDYYPVLFAEEQESYEKEQEEKEFEEFKSRRMKFANRHNAMYGGDAG